MRDTADRSLVPPSGWLGPEPAESGAPSAGFLAAATVLGAVLRLAWLTGQSLWVDELLTWRMLRPDAGLHFLEQVRDAIQGPLYLAVAWPLVRLGDPELMLRLPAAVAGALTVPVVGVVAGRLLDRAGARLAVLLVAINPFLVWYSREARGYAFVVLFGALMVLFFLRLAARGARGGDALGFALASAAAVWSNMSGLFLWAALGVTALPELRRGSRRAVWFAAFGGGLVAAAPWLLQAAGLWAVDRMLPGAATGAALRGETTFDPFAVPYTLFTFFFGFSYGPSLRELHQPDRLAAVRDALPWLVAAAVPAAVAGAAGLAAVLRRERRLLVWIVVPFLLLALLALRNVKPWNARYLAVAAPWVLLVAAAGLASLPGRVRVAVAALLCAATLVALGGLYTGDRYAKADLRGAAAWVADRDDGRPVLVPTVTGLWEFYGAPGGHVIDAWGAAPLADAADADRFVAERLAGVDAAWIVLAREWTFDPRDLLVPALSRRGRVRLAHEGAGVRVLAWEADPAPEPGPAPGGEAAGGD